MSQRHNGRGGPSFEERAETERENQREATAQALARQAAPQRSSGVSSDTILEHIADPGLARENVKDELPDKFATELNSLNALGNISRKEWERRKWLNEIQMDLAGWEHPDRQTKLDATDQVVMGYTTRVNGQDVPNEPLTEDDRRRYRAAADAKTMQQSLGINGKALELLAKIYAVTESHTENAGGDSGGRIDRLKQWVFG